MFVKLIRTSSFKAPRNFFCTSQSSYESPEDLRQKILKASLTHVNKTGWSSQTIAQTCVDLGYPAVTSGIITNGPIDLVYFAMDQWNAKLTQDLAYLELEQMRISDRITEGIKIRLSCQIPYLQRWHEAMALGSLPVNLPTTMGKLTDIADEIWYIAGDRSTDLNWYTKRGLLLSAYASTELFMLTDKSDNYVETWRFLDRRIKDILEYGKYINTARNFASGVGIGLNSLVSLFARYPSKIENDIEDIKRQYQQKTFDKPNEVESNSGAGKTN